MTTVSIKEKLHEYVEYADSDKLRAIFTLVQKEIADRTEMYDEAALNSFQETRDAYFSGKLKGSSAEESINRIRQKIHRK